MNKKETTEAINNFVEFNSQDIANLYRFQPEIANVFTNVLNALSKEYGSGDTFEEKIKSIKVEEEVVAVSERPAQRKEDLKIGDKVYIPKTKIGKSYGTASTVVNQARNNNQDYLYITNIHDNYYTLNFQTTYNGDYFRIDELEPYPNNPVIGDILVLRENDTRYRYRIDGFKKQKIGSVNAKITKLINGEDAGTFELDYLPLIGRIDKGEIYIEGLQQSEPAKVEPAKVEEKQIDPNNYEDLVGLTMQQTTARKFVEYKIKGIEKTNPKTVSYIAEKDGKAAKVSVEKTLITKILKGEVANNVLIKELFLLPEEEKAKRIKGLAPQKEDWKVIRDKFISKPIDSRLIKDLSPELKELALKNQAARKGGKRDENYQLSAAFSYADSTEGYDFWQSIRAGDWDFFYDNKPSTSQTQQAKYKLDIPTLPAELDYFVSIQTNKGDRPGPTESSGYLKGEYKGTSTEQKLFNTLFQGNDKQWYKLAERGSSWFWVKAKPEDVAKYALKDYSILSQEELKQLKKEMSDALEMLDPTDEEFTEIRKELEKLIKYIK